MKKNAIDYVMDHARSKKAAAVVEQPEPAKKKRAKRKPRGAK